MSRVNSINFLNISSKKTAISYVAVFLFLFAAILIFRLPVLVQADSVYLYPELCSGNWYNPSGAEGRPDLLDKSAPELFNPSNSAIYDNGSKQILCGQFGGEIPPGVEIERVKLALIWSERSDLGNEPASILPAPTSETESKSDTSGMENRLDNSGVEINESASVPETEDKLDNPGVEINQPADTPDASSAPSISTFIDPVALATGTVIGASEALDDSGNKAPNDSGDKIAPDSNPEEALAPATSTDNLSNGNSSSNSSADNSSAKVSAKFILVRYSYDGSSWHELARVDSFDSLAELVLPLDSWEQIGGLRFSIEAENWLRPIYLDGLALKIEYHRRGLDIAPDFKNNELVSIKSNEVSSLMLLRDLKDESYSLWLYSHQNGAVWQRIDTSDSVRGDGPIALKDNYAFWLSKDGLSLIGYNLSANNYFSQSIDPATDPGLSFGANYLEAKYEGGDLTLINKENGDTKSFDDHPELGQPVITKFQDAQPEAVLPDSVDSSAVNSESVKGEERPSIFDLNFIDNKATITVLDPPPLDNLDQPGQKDQENIITKDQENIITNEGVSSSLPIISKEPESVSTPSISAPSVSAPSTSTPSGNKALDNEVLDVIAN